MSRLVEIAVGPNRTGGTVVFVHGLRGDPFTTWGGKENDPQFWPRWIAEDIEALAVYSLSYEADATERKGGSAMSLVERGQNILQLLLMEPALRRAPVAFVCHSLGGLVIKQFLRCANEQKENSSRISELLARVTQVVFIATPHGGSRIPRIMKRFRWLARPTDITRDLASDRQLFQLYVWYRDFCNPRTRDIDHLTFRETKKTHGQIIVGDRDADPGVGGEIIPIHANHNDICKPAVRDELLYKRTRLFLETLPERKSNSIQSDATPARAQIDAQERARSGNLPHHSKDKSFKGREAIMQRMRQSLTRAYDPGTTIVCTALYGLGGIGKTLTAIEYAWAHRLEYNALLFVTATTAAVLRRDLIALSHELELSERCASDEEAKFHAVIEWLKQNPGWLLILDGLDAEEELPAVERLMAQIHGGHVLITSRLSNFPAQVESIELGVLSVENAVAFLMERTHGRRRAESSDESAARPLVQSLGELPVALEQAAAFIESGALSFGEYQSELRENWNKVMQWNKPAVTHYPHSVLETWQRSINRLNEPSRRMLHRLAWLAPEPVPKDLLRLAIPSAEPQDLTEALSGLAANSLVSYLVEGPFFSIHRLVQEAVRHSLGEADARRSLVEALRWIDTAFRGDPGDVRTWPQLDSLVPHALSVTRFADEKGIMIDETVQLENRIASFTISRIIRSQQQLPGALSHSVLWFQDVTRLGFKHSRMELELETLKQLSGLQQLSLRHVYFGNPAFLAKLANLQNLDLGRTKVIDLTALKELSKLRSLDLWRTKVRDIRPLAALTSLQSLSLGNTEVKDVSALADLANLKNLDLSDTNVTSVTKLATLTNLRRINLGGNRIRDVRALANLVNLESLDLSDTKVIDIAAVSKLTKLRQLKLNGTRVSNLSHLAKLDGLITLDVSGTRVRDRGLSALANAVTLRSLSLGGTRIKNLAPLARLTTLQSLNLGSTRVTDVAGLRPLAELERLDLRGTKVKDVAPLAALTHLRSLDLAHTSVSDVAPLTGLTNLKVLHLEGTGKIDVAALRANIPGLEIFQDP